MSADFSVIDYLDFEAGTVRVTGDSGDLFSLPALKQHYVQQAKRFADTPGAGIDAVYFSGEYPSVYFKRVSSFTSNVVQSIVSLQRKVWNQGKVPFLYVESDTEVRVYNCYETPQRANEPGAEQKLRLLNVQRQGEKAEEDLATLRSVFDKVAIESGRFWEEDNYAKQVDVKKRVDQALVDNIKRPVSNFAAEVLKSKMVSSMTYCFGRCLFCIYKTGVLPTKPFMRNICQTLIRIFAFWRTKQLRTGSSKN